MLPAGAWPNSGSEGFWYEQHALLRGRLARQDEELRALQNTVMRQTAELLALKEVDRQWSPKPPPGRRAADAEVQTEPVAPPDPASPARPAAELNVESLQRTLRALETRTLSIQDEVQSANIAMRQYLTHRRTSDPPPRRLPPSASPLVRDSALVHEAARGPHTRLWAEFLQWLRGRGILDMDQLRRFLVTHASPQFLKDLLADCEADDLFRDDAPDAPGGEASSSLRQFSVLSTLTDVPITDPRPMGEDAVPGDHPPALSWEIAQYEAAVGPEEGAGEPGALSVSVSSARPSATESSTFGPEETSSSTDAGASVRVAAAIWASVEAAAAAARPKGTSPRRRSPNRRGEPAPRKAQSIGAIAADVRMRRRFAGADGEPPHPPPAGAATTTSPRRFCRLPNYPGAALGSPEHGFRSPRTFANPSSGGPSAHPTPTPVSLTGPHYMRPLGSPRRTPSLTPVAPRRASRTAAAAASSTPLSRPSASAFAADGASRRSVSTGR